MAVRAATSFLETAHFANSFEAIQRARAVFQSHPGFRWTEPTARYNTFEGIINFGRNRLWRFDPFRIDFAWEAGMNEPKLIVENITDPIHVTETRAQISRGKLNSAWLAEHWCELLPNVRGRYVAVAGQEAFVADTAGEAWALAKAAHPTDDGAIMQFVRTDTNPRIYANRR